MLAVSIEFQLAFKQGKGVWGILFQAFENDIELRLELQFCIENHCVFLKTFFLHDGYVQ